MAKDDKLEPTEELLDEEDLVSRRDFLVGLGKWSKIVIGLALLGGTLAMPENDATAQTTWANGGRGGWANRYGGGGWANRGGGGWANGGFNPGWNNVGGGGWHNHGGGGWHNKGGGGAWANRAGGGGWANRRGGWYNLR
jgi:hypothetical protein